MYDKADSMVKLEEMIERNLKRKTTKDGEPEENRALLLRYAKLLEGQKRIDEFFSVQRRILQILPREKSYVKYGFTVVRLAKEYKKYTIGEDVYKELLRIKT